MTTSPAPLPAIVTDASQAVENVRAYNRIVEKVPTSKYETSAVVRMIPFVQSWYYVPLPGGKYLFAPSKFIGYANIDEPTYQAHHEALNGRVTEKRLAQMATLITPEHPKYAEIRRALAAFCARFGATPNGRARVSQLISPSQASATAEPADTACVDAIMTLIARMPSAVRAEIKKRLAA